ncbi:tetratricopeptide repeat protein [Sphingomonas sp. I4]
MARTAVEAGNDDEAIAYFNRVLEADPTVSEAWLGKGRAVARLSSLKHVRIRETATAFGHAIGSTPEADRASVREIALVELVAFATRLYQMSRSHWAKYQQIDGTAEQGAATALAIADALEVGLRWAPHHRPALDIAITVCANALTHDVDGGQAVLLRQKLEGSSRPSERSILNLRLPKTRQMHGTSPGRRSGRLRPPPRRRRIAMRCSWDSRLQR